MKSVNKVVVIGDGDLGIRIGDLFNKAGLPVFIDSKVSNTDELADADMVIEATSGEADLRRETLRRCDEKIQQDAILATTASSGITELAVLTQKPSRFTGLHFTFNPFQDGCLVEIVKGLDTSVETVAACADLLTSVGVKTVATADSPGLLLDRVMALAINEAAIMHTTGVASIEYIDRVAKSCLNWPAGPFEFADIIGIDRVLSTLELLSHEVGPRFLPCRLLRQMVAMGKLGRKTGKGFYTYS